jgi:hypothetical protein
MSVWGRIVVFGKDAREDGRSGWRGKAKPRYLSQYDCAPPRYDGPHWIGKPITAPPATVGPDWIGKALPYRRNYTLPPSDNIGA